MARSRLVAALLVLLLPSSASAARLVLGPWVPSERVRLELTLVDVPFDVHGGELQLFAPSQALSLTTSFYGLTHAGLRAIADPYASEPGEVALGITLVSALDTLTFFVAGPLGSAWSHEELHRAVLTAAGVESTNPLSTGFALPLFEPATIELSTAVADRLERDDPESFAYVNVAGFHAHALLTRRFEALAFFDDQPTLDVFIAGFNTLLPIVYDLSCLASSDGDCAWQVRHHFAPGEASLARALTADEEGFLTLQLVLSLLNLLDPFLYGVRGLETYDGEYLWSAAVRHVPTPYGQQVGIDAYLRTHGWGARAGLAAGFNAEGVFPSLDGELRFPLGEQHLSLGAGLWLQPATQSYRDGSVRPGGLVRARIGVPLVDGRVEPFLELEGKSRGWVLGSPWLAPQASLFAGALLAL